MNAKAISNEQISAAKITPLESDVKRGVQHDLGERGPVPNDENIDKARINPEGGAGHFKHPAPHADNSGVIGHDKDIQEAKIEPMASQDHSVKTADPNDRTGLEDEVIDGARIGPLGEVREEIDLQQKS
ncbi:MAG: hypothetical protein Q9159_002303 [Coniocarpon cinnabarinum]